MSKRSSLSHCLLTGFVLQSALVGCGNDSGSGLLVGAVGGSATTSPGNGGSAATVQGGGNGVGGAAASTLGGSQSGGAANGGNAATVGGATNATGGKANAGGSSTGGTSAGGASTGGATNAGGAATGGKAATGGAVNAGGAATGGKATTGGAVNAGGAVTGGKAATGGVTTTATGGATTTATGGKAATGGATSTTVGTGPAETKPMGYGQNTTGGGSVAATNVATLAAAQAAVDAYSGTGGLVLNYTGTFNYASITDPCAMRTATAEILEIKDISNITVMGAAGSAAHFGIHIAGDAHNIIVRNMTFGLLAGGDYSDMISVEGMGTDRTPSEIWIDHNTMYTSLVECDGAGDLEFDGMVDVKKGANNITVSYNYMHDHHKATLNGFSDSDTETRYITYHHNLFEKIGSRTPLQRAGFSHMLNNYFLNVTVTGINVRMGGQSLIEANYFENVKNPVTARDSTSIGYWDLRNNNLLTKADVSAGNAFGITWGSVTSPDVNATEWVTTKAYPAVSYTYKADPFQCVHDGLRAVVGAGKGLVTLKCN